MGVVYFEYSNVFTEIPIVPTGSQILRTRKKLKVGNKFSRHSQYSNRGLLSKNMQR